MRAEHFEKGKWVKDVNTTEAKNDRIYFKYQSKDEEILISIENTAESVARVDQVWALLKEHFTGLDQTIR